MRGGEGGQTVKEQQIDSEKVISILKVDVVALRIVENYSSMLLLVLCSITGMSAPKFDKGIPKKSYTSANSNKRNLRKILVFRDGSLSGRKGNL